MDNSTGIKEDFSREGFGKPFIPETLCGGVSLDVNPEAAQFTCTEGGATEFEYLWLIGALVSVFKPTLMVETGTWTGTGSVAMIRGAEAGAHLITVNDSPLRPDATQILDAEAERRGCSWELVQQNTNNIEPEQWRELLQGRCTFAFLDSSIKDRPWEFACLSDPCQGILDLTRPCCVVIHDMSSHRPASEDGAADLPGAVATLHHYAALRGWSFMHLHQSRGAIVLTRYPLPL